MAALTCQHERQYSDRHKGGTRHTSTRPRGDKVWKSKIEWMQLHRSGVRRHKWPIELNVRTSSPPPPLPPPQYAFRIQITSSDCIQWNRIAQWHRYMRVCVCGKWHGDRHSFEFKFFLFLFRCAAFLTCSFFSWFFSTHMDCRTAAAIGCSRASRFIHRWNLNRLGHESCSRFHSHMLLCVCLLPVCGVWLFDA